MAKTGKTNKKSVVKKPAKTTPKKAVQAVKKAPAKKVVVKKAVKPSKPVKLAKPAPQAKPVKKISKVVVSKAVPASAPAKKPTAAPTPVKKNQDPLGMNNKVLPKQSASHLSTAFITEQKTKLVELHDHILDQMQSVAQDNLRSRPEGSEASAFGMHQADAGSDAYDKDFALSLLSQEQDALYEIEEALKRIENGAYGICEMSSKPIPKNRLEAIPFARFTVECQSQLEKENKGRRRWDTAPQFMDSEDTISDEDEEVVDEEGNRKEKE
ncbi:MAG: TraR/DksA C4-type zinc finger protein [Verrucomicrobiota bacterium]